MTTSKIENDQNDFDHLYQMASLLIIHNIS